MNDVYFICSESGDEYKLQFTTERSGMITPELLDRINHDGIEVIEIGLGRSKGNSTTSPLILNQINQTIADVFEAHPNAVICFFCDFINFIPSMSKRRRDMTVQQYRSLLFSQMFERFTTHHHLDDIYNRVVTIEGVSEPYYFHIIARKVHLPYANMIEEEFHKDFDK